MKYRSDGVVVASIEVEGNAGAARSFAAKHGLTFPMLLDHQNAYGTLRGHGLLASRAIPANVILDRRGVVRYSSSGFNPGAMHRMIDRLLRE